MIPKQKIKLRNRSLGILMVLSAILYLSYPFFSESVQDTLYLNGCVFKATTHLPCPGCGYSRAMIQLREGHFFEAFKFHPLYPLLILFALFILYAGVRTIIKGRLLSLSNFWTYTILLCVLLAWIAKFAVGKAFY